MELPAGSNAQDNLADGQIKEDPENPGDNLLTQKGPGQVKTGTKSTGTLEQGPPQENGAGKEAEPPKKKELQPLEDKRRNLSRTTPTMMKHYSKPRRNMKIFMKDEWRTTFLVYHPKIY